MVSHIDSVEEYDKIVLILKGNLNSIEENKMNRYRLKNKAESFILIDDLLYLLDDDGLHKRVLYRGQEMVMKMEVHKQNHYGQNRLFEVCKKLFFAIPREIVREVCIECVVCAQAQPLKTKKRVRHILAKKHLKG
jgi:sulfur transfer complex TusBCD TusB component (DsrH family)